MNKHVERHSETVRGSWRGGFSGIGRIESGTWSCAISAPAAIGGSGYGVNPSSLLVAAASGCFLLTLAAIIQHRGADIVELLVETEGVFRGYAPPELSAINHRATAIVTKSSSTTTNLLRECVEMARSSCMATRAMPNVVFSVTGATAVEGAVAKVVGN